MSVDKMMTNSQIAAVLEEIAAMLEKKKDNIFKIRAYRRVARAIQGLSEPVVAMVADNRLHEIPGVGEAITRKITELVDTGKLEYYEKLKTEFSERPRAVGN